MKKKIHYFLFFAASISILSFIFTYLLLFADNIRDNADSENYIFYIRTGSTYTDVLTSLHQQHILKNEASFKLLCRKLHYDEQVKPGRYKISNTLGNLLLLRKLRGGYQDPVKITFNNIQNKDQLAEKVAKQLEASKRDLLKEFDNPRFLDSLHLTEENFPTIFLANTYEFYWNTSARQFIERMLKEYNKFWTTTRRERAKELGLSPTEVTILASIIQKESNHYDEYPTIAGVYINRLHKGMPLQADPTVMYALKKLGVNRRVYHGDLKIQSPYNTYLHQGLPPGPICLPERESIEQTLNAEEHNYMYFCAKEDFSGYAVFAETWQQHLENARRYQKALNERNIH